MLLSVLPLAAALCLGAPDPAHTYEEFHGVRSAGMGGAQRAVGTSNDTLTLNPAGMAVVPRYALELQYAYLPKLGLSHINISAVDSKSSPVAGGVAYTHDKADN